MGSRRVWVGVAFLALTIASLFLAATMSVSASLRFGPSRQVSPADHVAFGPASDGSALIYREGCPNATSSIGRDGSIVHTCNPNAVGVVDLKTGDSFRVPFPENLNAALLASFVNHTRFSDPYLVQNGTWVTIFGVFDLQARTWSEHMPYPSSFGPDVRDGLSIFSSSAWDGQLTRFRLDTKEVTTWAGPPNASPCFSSSILRAEADTILYRECWTGAAYWIGDLRESDGAWRKLRIEGAGSEPSFLNHMADMSQGTVIAAWNHKNGATIAGYNVDALRQGHEIDAPHQAWVQEFAGPESIEVQSIYANAGRWVAEYIVNDPEGGSPLEIGFFHGSTDGSRTKRIVIPNPGTSGRIAGGAFPVGDDVFYDYSGTIVRATPGGYPFPPWIVWGLPTIGFVGSAAWWLHMRKPRPAIFAGLSCPHCGERETPGLLFCTRCGTARADRQPK